MPKARKAKERFNKSAWIRSQPATMNAKDVLKLPKVPWSTDEEGGGFSFINPSSRPDAPNGFRAPVENQGLSRFGFFSDGVPQPQWQGLQGEFKLLREVEWRTLYVAKEFEAAGFKGHPL